MPIDLRGKLRRHRKDNRVIVGGLALLLLLMTGAFYLVQRSRDLPSFLVTNRVLLFVLWYVNVVLILTVLFVLLRNLFKLLVERRHRILGSTFKFKLVATYVGMSLIPVLLLFAIATELLQGSVDRWFNTPLKPVLAAGSTVAQALYDRVERDNLRAASAALAQVSGLDRQRAQARPLLNRRLQDLLGELDVDLLAVYEGTEFVHAAIDSQSGIPELPDPGRAFLLEAAARGRAVRRQEPPGGHGGRLVLAAVSQVSTPGPPLVVVAGSLVEPSLAAPSESLIQSFQSYRQLEVQKDDLRASHLLIFLMVTLLILLASSWMGLYLARRVTVPILALAEGTRRISGGDLGHRVDVQADDELGVLVDSFNQMTRELASNKDLLERGNRELAATNQRLDEERALLAAVLQNVAAGVVSTDAQGRIFTCNGAALHILRQGAEEVVGRRVPEAWGDRERAKLAALLTLEASPGAPEGTWSREIQLLLGGEWKTLDAKVTTIRADDGALLGQVLVIEDLTELIKAQQLAAWSDAARRIAHEIKNPLTPIRLAAERLLRKSRQEDPGLAGAVEEAVDIIVREVGTLQGMVDEFSRFARMPRPRPAPVDLARLLEDTLHLYRNLKPGVEIEGGILEPREPLAGVQLDAEQIKRALINLLDNAVEATDPPGSVTVSAHAVDGRLEIQVADTGRGIAPESKEKLFLPYFSTKGRGTGLGLAIVHRIVADHRGSVRVEDNVPHGTVFTVELPL
ncbi:MAG TPA: ATP-binding protein [Thermoanaerobaculia bacterium]|nr:ATP-binding protein [Thermoanaerobaculia bacterium]